MATIDELLSNTSSGPNNRVGTLESVFSGVASGLIAIPKGFFSLGATLLDLGAGTNKAAEVEAFFDDLTTFDEKAEATAAGKLVETLVNIGIPGGIAFKQGQRLAKSAVRAVRGNTYFKPSQALVETAEGVGKLNVRQAGLVPGTGSKELRKRLKRSKFLTGAAAGGVAEGVFVGDVEGIGTFGDLLGGPTEINREEDKNDPARQLINRIKFGTEGALFTGVLGGIGATIKKLATRSDDAFKNGSRLEQWFFDVIATNLRKQGKTTKEFFDQQRSEIGKRSSDAARAKFISKEIEQIIDEIFPPFRGVMAQKFNLKGADVLKKRDAALKVINDILLSGDPKIINKPILNEAGEELFKQARKETPNLTKDDFIKQLDVTRRRQFSTYKQTADFGPIADAEKDKLFKLLKDEPRLKDKENINAILAGLSRIRSKWGDMFTTLGATQSKENFGEFAKIYKDTVSSWLGQTYELFQNRNVMGIESWRPADETIAKAVKEFQKVAATKGIDLQKEQALYYVNNILKTAKLKPRMAEKIEMTGPSFKVPEDFFTKKSATDKIKSYSTVKGLNQLEEAGFDKKVFEELLGKTQNPMQTILTATSRLALITRRNEFFSNLDNLSKNAVEEANAFPKKLEDWRAAGSNPALRPKKPNEPFVVSTEDEARKFFGDDFTGPIEIDPSKTLEAGSINPLEGKYARTGVAEALIQTNKTNRDSGAMMRLYENFILYPKATSQMAKTIFSPVTHARNFISATAFAAANGIIPLRDPDAVKNAFRLAGANFKGTQQQQEFYEELLELGVVNSNVRLGDLSRLLEDVKFGETMTSDKGLRLLLKPLSRLKRMSEDLYTAEDDFWKIYTFSQEQKRLADALLKNGIKKGETFTDGAGRTIKFTDDYIKREAADIVKNNVPNYDYVGEFVKGLRKLPVGNFVSFPAEILRTGTNIVRRGLKEVNETIVRADGTTVKPFQGIGYTRLFGMGATTVAVPYALTEAFKALYNVTSDEMEALRRYVPDWSKNSTLIPIKGEDGKFKYIDFSHTNAYDTLTRPIQTVLNSISQGRTDQDGIMDDFLAGLFNATKELGEPFVSESIWTEAAVDVLPKGILGRGGVSSSGARVYNPEDTYGDKAGAIFKHIFRSQVPFSADQLKRIGMGTLKEIGVDQKGVFNKYGETYELGNELGGLVGFRAVEVNPAKSLKFKIRDYQQGVRDSRSLFTAKSLRGGPVDPQEIVQNYINANRALYSTRQDFQKDIDGARVLGLSESDLLSEVSDRMSSIDFRSIDNDIFRPLAISDNVRIAFANNAANLGVTNPFLEAFSAIIEVQQELRSLNLSDDQFPLIQNPLLPSTSPVSGPNSLNLPNIDQQTLSQTSRNNLTTKESFDRIYPGFTNLFKN
jgi:hypothetical protein